MPPNPLNYHGMTNRVNWTIDTRAIQPRTIQILRGETVALDVDLTSYGSPVDLAGATCSAFWRSPDMASGAGWYTSPATCSGNRVLWVWDGATMDAGADVYEWYIGVDAGGLSYRPCGRIQMLGSPAGNPSAIPIPSPVLDFAKYTVVNSPFPTFAEEGAAIEAATSALVSVSALDAYMTADETTDAIQSATEAATSGKADRSDLALYLPLSGGAVLGPLTADTITAAHPVEVRGRYYGTNSISRGSEHLDFPSGTGVFALTSDIQSATSGKADASAFDAYYTSAETNVAIDSATSGKADRADLALYLPISGGANAGTIAWDTPYMLKTTRADLRLYNGYLWLNNTAIAPRPATEQAVQLTLPQRDGRLALVSDVDAATSGKADASALSAYYTSAQTDMAISTAITSAIGDIDTVLDGINGEVI